MADRTPGRRHHVRRIVALAFGGALILAAVGIAPAAGTPAAGSPWTMEVAAAAAPYVDIATLTSTDLGGYETKVGTARLTTYVNAAQTAFSKQTLRFAVHDLGQSALYYVRIFQGTCTGEDQTFILKIAVRTDAAGRLPKTVTLSSAQRAKMWKAANENPAVSLYLWPDEPSTGASYPCGRIWDAG
jgi:hypothetical protein